MHHGPRAPSANSLAFSWSCGAHAGARARGPRPPGPRDFERQATKGPVPRTRLQASHAPCISFNIFSMHSLAVIHTAQRAATTTHVIYHNTNIFNSARAHVERGRRCGRRPGPPVPLQPSSCARCWRLLSKSGAPACPPHLPIYYMHMHQAQAYDVEAPSAALVGRLHHEELHRELRRVDRLERHHLRGCGPPHLALQVALDP